MKLKSINESIGGRRLHGAARLVLELLAQNCVLLFIVVLAIKLTALDQIRDIGIALADEPLLLRSFLPQALFSLLLSLSSIVAALMAGRRTADITEIYRLPGGLVGRISYVVVPILLSLFGPLCGMTIIPQPGWPQTLTVVTGIVCTVAAIAVLAHRFILGNNAKTVFLLSLALTVVCVAILLLALEARISRRLGVAGLVLVALGGWGAVLNTTVVFLIYRVRLPGVLVCALGILYLLAPRNNEPEPVPSVPSASDLSNPHLPTLGTHFQKWLVQRYKVDPGVPIPVFFVSAEGGGIRAAYWTARRLAILDVDTGGDFARHVFAYSGVSGGSLGIATFLDATNNRRLVGVEMVRAIDRFYENDFLAPLASQLLVAVPLRTISFGIVKSVRRDIAFERQLAADWLAATGSQSMALPFLRAIQPHPEDVPPVVVLNATRAETGLRVVLSNVRIADGLGSRSHNLFGLLYPWGSLSLTMAEAVHLSARFPVVSPPASVYAPYFVPYQRLRSNSYGMTREASDDCSSRFTPDERCGQWSLKHWGTIVDGGFVDNSGVASLRDIFSELSKLRTEAISDTEDDSALDSQDALYRSLLRRVSFHILIIRNGAEPLVDLWQDPASKLMTEIEALTRTILQSRAARAGTEVGFLSQQIKEASIKSVDGVPLCPMSNIGRIGLPTPMPVLKFRHRQISSTCHHLPDTMTEVGLNDDADLEKIVSRYKDRFPSDALSCRSSGSIVEPPLGWTLSKASRETIQCRSEMWSATRFGRAELHDFSGYWVYGNLAQKQGP